MGIANELITRGWCQGMMWDEHGRVCLWGAARMAVQEMTADEPYPLAAEKRLVRLASGTLDDIITREYHYHNFIAFNDDAHNTTYDDVLRVAKEADEILGW